MQTWGEVRIRQRRVVVPEGCDVDRPGPKAVAQWWAQQGVHGIHVTDQDGALAQGRNWLAVEAATSAGLPVRFGGGVRHMAQVQQLMELGVRQVVVATQALDHPEWCAELCRIFPDGILLGVDMRGPEIVVDGRRRPVEDGMLDALTRQGPALAGILYAAVDDDGLGVPDAGAVGRLAELGPVTVAASWLDAHEVEAMVQAGAGGILLTPESSPQAWGGD